MSPSLLKTNGTVEEVSNLVRLPNLQEIHTSLHFLERIISTKLTITVFHWL